jgi:hypothetical protein
VANEGSCITSSYGRVFDSNLQRSVDSLQEENILRRGGHRFGTRQDQTPSSYLVYGTITQEGGWSPSFVGVEVHTYGAASVYFRECTSAATIDELMGWWVYGAWRIALEVHALLGTSGPAHAAVLIDPAGISDPSLPRRRNSLVMALHGPFPLRPGGSKEEQSDWAQREAGARIAAVRADILRKSIGRAELAKLDVETDWTLAKEDVWNLVESSDRIPDEESWTPGKVQRRLYAGRPADPGTDAGCYAPRRGGPRRRTEGRG